MRTLLIVFVSLVLLSCADTTSIPDCITMSIESFKKDTNICSDANVKAYQFQQDTVYVFELGTCGADFTSEVLNGECSSLGLLGGIIGNTTINNEDFSSAVLIETVWEK